ncbi:hypothetical protein ACJ22U_004951, partial [Escherichia coli]
FHLIPHFPTILEMAQTSFLAARVTVAVADHQPMVEPAESHLLDLYLIVMFPLSVLIPLFIF